MAATASEAVQHGRPWLLAAKTGTTDGGRDAWFADFILSEAQTRQAPIRPRVTFVVWAGHDDNRPAERYGGAIHGPVFHSFLQDARVEMALRVLLRP